jgi:hypothetical protein
MNSVKTFFNDLTCENKVLDSCYSVEYEYYQDNGVYIYKLTCDNYWPTVGVSKYFIEARMIAYKLMLFNINHNIMYNEIINLKIDPTDPEVKNDEYEFHIKNMNEELEPYVENVSKHKLDEPLKNTKATEAEKEVEEYYTSGSYLYNNDINWDYMPDDEKKQFLDKELEEYRNPTKEESDPEREKLPSLKVPVAKDSPPVFARLMIFKPNDLSFNYKI